MIGDLRVLRARARFMASRYEVLCALGDDAWGALCDSLLAADELAVAEAVAWVEHDDFPAGLPGDTQEVA